MSHSNNTIMFSKIQHFFISLPWWWLFAYVGGMGFAFYKVGPVNQEPVGNTVFGLLLFLGLGSMFFKLATKPKE